MCTPTSIASSPTARRRPRCAASASPAVDFAIECQMDKLAHLVGMDPMEFRILNAYRDGDMKAHRREAKNTALIECVQVAAEKAEMADARRVQAHVLAQGRRRRRAPSSPPPPREVADRRPAAPRRAQQRTSYDRAAAAGAAAWRRTEPHPAAAAARLRRRAAAAARRSMARYGSPPCSAARRTLTWPSIADAAWRRSTIRSA